MSVIGGKYYGSLLCTFCGRSVELSKKFYKTIGRKPFYDEVYICDECMEVLQRRAKWIKDRKIEVIK